MEYMRGPVVRCQLQNAESFMARVGRGLSGPERLSPSGGAFNKTYFNATTNGCTATIYIYIDSAKTELRGVETDPISSNFDIMFFFY